VGRYGISVRGRSRAWRLGARRHGRRVKAIFIGSHRATWSSGTNFYAYAAFALYFAGGVLPPAAIRSSSS